MTAFGHQPPQEALPVDAARADAVLLALVSGIGPRHRRALVERFGSATAVLDAAPSALREVSGIGPKLCAAVARARETIDVSAEFAECARRGIMVLTEGDAGYPRSLGEIHDPPGVLFVRGELREADGLAVAIVGSRHATQYGLAQAERLAESLSRAGLTIVSGLARGIDAAAHRGALRAGGRTLAVLGSGLANVYPPEHAELADDITRSGAIVSELPPRAAPLAGTFPQRNRLISGLTLGVLVVEAALRSGALITARHAMEQGRDVFAVPGRVDNRLSQGCHRLIRDGAALVESADDVLEALGHLVAAVPTEDGRRVHHPAELSLNDVERQVLDAVGGEPTAIETLVERTQLAAHQVLATLSVLEIRRLVQRVSGSGFVRR